MDPSAWRKKSQLTLRDLAGKLGCTRMTVFRYERGEREAPTSVALAYERESKNEKGVSQVTADDLNRVRKRYLRAQSSSTKAAA